MHFSPKQRIYTTYNTNQSPRSEFTALLLRAQDFPWGSELVLGNTLRLFCTLYFCPNTSLLPFNVVWVVLGSWHCPVLILCPTSSTSEPSAQQQPCERNNSFIPGPLHTNDPVRGITPLFLSFAHQQPL